MTQRVYVFGMIELLGRVDPVFFMDDMNNHTMPMETVQMRPLSHDEYKIQQLSCLWSFIYL